MSPTYIANAKEAAHRAPPQKGHGALFATVSTTPYWPLTPRHKVCSHLASHTQFSPLVFVLSGPL